MKYLLKAFLLSFFFYPFSFVFFLVSCSHPTPQESMKNLRVIEGNWESYKGVGFNENWRLANDSLFEGEGFSMNETDTVFFENLRIYKKSGSVFYSVGLTEGENVDFLLTNTSSTSWEFRNPKNEFPSIIKYHLENDSLLSISIANIRGNKEQFFYLKRKQPRN